MELNNLYKCVGLLSDVVFAVHSLPVYSLYFHHSDDGVVTVSCSIKPEIKVDYDRLLDDIFDLKTSARELGYDLDWSDGHFKTDHRFSFVFNKIEDYGKKKKKK